MARGDGSMLCPSPAAIQHAWSPPARLCCPHPHGAPLSYVAGWLQADPSTLIAAAISVLGAVNTVAVGLVLDNVDDAINQPTT